MDEFNYHFNQEKHIREFGRYIRERLSSDPLIIELVKAASQNACEYHTRNFKKRFNKMATSFLEIMKIVDSIKGNVFSALASGADHKQNILKSTYVDCSKIQEKFEELKPFIS